MPKNGDAESREDLFVAVWPVASRKKEDYIIIPLSQMTRKFGPRDYNKDIAFKYTIPGKGSAVGHVLVVGASEAKVRAEFSADKRRVVYPNRKFADSTGVGTTDDDSQKSNRKETPYMRKKLKQTANISNSQNILEKYSQKVGSQVTNLGLNSSRSPPQTSSIQPAETSIASALSEMRALKKEIAEYHTATETLCHQAKREREEAAAERKKAEQESSKAKEERSVAAMERKKAKDERMKVEAERERAESERQKVEELHNKVVVEIKKFREEHAKLRLKTPLSDGYLSSSSTSSGSNSIQSLRRFAHKDFNKGESESEKDSESVLIHIGGGVKVDKTYWDMAMSASNKEDFALYCLLGAFGTDAKYCRVNTPRDPDPLLRKIPDYPPYVEIFQNKYVEFLKANPQIVLDFIQKEKKKSKRQKQKKDATVQEELTSEEESEEQNTETNEHRVLSNIDAVKILSRKFGGLLGTRAVGLYRQGKRKLSEEQALARKVKYHESRSQDKSKEAIKEVPSGIKSNIQSRICSKDGENAEDTESAGTKLRSRSSSHMNRDIIHSDDSSNQSEPMSPRSKMYLNTQELRFVTKTPKIDGRSVATSANKNRPIHEVDAVFDPILASTQNSEETDSEREDDPATQLKSDTERNSDAENWDEGSELKYDTDGSETQYHPPDLDGSETQYNPPNSDGSESEFHNRL